MPRFAARVKPRFPRGESTVACGRTLRTARSVCGSWPLSTTVSVYGREGGCALSDPRQRRSRPCDPYATTTTSTAGEPTVHRVPLQGGIAGQPATAAQAAGQGAAGGRQQPLRVGLPGDAGGRAEAVHPAAQPGGRTVDDELAGAEHAVLEQHAGQA